MRAMASPERTGTGTRIGRSPVVVFGEVAGERIVGKVATRVTPHGVHVVCIARRVVVLGEQGRTVQAVVVRLPRFQPAGPQEMHAEPENLAASSAATSSGRRSTYSRSSASSNSR